MIAFGFKRTTKRCIVTQAGHGKKILFDISVKNRKNGRKAKHKEQYEGKLS
jgi:hypothetical protein